MYAPWGMGTVKFQLMSLEGEVSLHCVCVCWGVSPHVPRVPPTECLLTKVKVKVRILDSLLFKLVFTSSSHFLHEYE